MDNSWYVDTREEALKKRKELRKQGYYATFIKAKFWRGYNGSVYTQETANRLFKKPIKKPILREGNVATMHGRAKFAKKEPIFGDAIDETVTVVDSSDLNIKMLRKTRKDKGRMEGFM